MRIFKNKWFERFARKEGIDDAALCAAVEQVEKGLIDADLGGGVLKQRIARPGEGKSGGFRSIVVFRRGARAVFVYGFPKRSRANIKDHELRGFKALARELLGYDDAALAKAARTGALKEVSCSGEEDEKREPQNLPE